MKHIKLTLQLKQIFFPAKVISISDRDRGGHRGNYGSFGEDNYGRGGGVGGGSRGPQGGMSGGGGFVGSGRPRQDRRPINDDIPSSAAPGQN